jgi:uncharacterized FlgJ-related protein
MNLHYWDKKILNYVKISKESLIRIIMFTFGVVCISTIIAYKYGFNIGKKAEIGEKDIVLIYQEIENTTFTRRKFYEYLKQINIKFPELVFAQAIKESSFKSSLWKNNNNPFGMKEATKRPNKQNGSQHGHAYYDTWKDAIIDYALYQSYIGLSKMKTEEEYLNFIKEMNYYDTSHPNNVNYLDDLKKISTNIESYMD